MLCYVVLCYAVVFVNAGSGFESVSQQLHPTLRQFGAHLAAHHAVGNYYLKLGVLSHHLNCEMKSPHLVDFS